MVKVMVIVVVVFVVVLAAVGKRKTTTTTTNATTTNSSKKTITSKPQGHHDFGNTQTALTPKRTGQKIQLWHWPTKRTHMNFCRPALKQGEDAPESPNRGSAPTLAKSTKPEAPT